MKISTIHFYSASLKLIARGLALLVLLLNPYLIRSLARKLIGSLKADRSSRDLRLRVIYVTDNDLYYGGFFDGKEVERIIMLGGFSLFSTNGSLYEALIDFDIYLRAYGNLASKLDLVFKDLFIARDTSFSDIIVRLHRLLGRDGITDFLIQGLGVSLSKKSKSHCLLLPIEGRSWERALCSGFSNTDDLVGYVPTILTEKNEGFYHFSWLNYPSLYPGKMLVPGLVNRDFLRSHGFQRNMINWFYMRDSSYRTCKLENTSKCYDLLLVLSGTLSNDIKFINKVAEVSGRLSVCCRPNPRARMSKKLTDLINERGFMLTRSFPSARIILAGSSTFCLENAQLVSGKLVYVMHMGDNELLTPNTCIELYRKIFEVIDYKYINGAFIDRMMSSDGVSEACAHKERLIMQMIGLRPEISRVEVFELLDRVMDQK